MVDDPTEADFEEIRRLKALSPRFRKGWVKLHPMPEKHRELIAAAFRQPRQGQVKATAATKSKSAAALRRQQTEQKQSEDAQRKTQGPRHSH